MAVTDAPVDGAVGKDGEHGGKRQLHGEDHLRLLPPSANWYCSKICDCGHSDVFGLLLAFGAKNSVFIYQAKNDADAHDTSGTKSAGSGVKVSFFAQLVRGKRDRRVTAVQFLTDTTGELRLVCGGEEGSVQIWDVASLTLIEQHRKHKAEVMAITVSSTLDANFVLAGDRQGRISAWERDAGKVSVFMPVSGDGIHSIAISPHDKALVAVGYRSGVLCLVDAAQGTVRHRLDGHDQEVQCVAWKPPVEASHSSIEDETSSKDPGGAGREVWLASSSRDKTIKVWKIALNAAEEPALEQVLRLPTGKQGMSFTQTKQLWLPVTWSTNSPTGKHCLWSGSFDGSLFRWEWNATKAEDQAKKGKSRRASCKPIVVKGGHSRILFAIVAMPPRSSVLVEDGSVSMLTVSLDRELRLWKENPPSKSAPAATCVEKLTGLGGHAYSTSYSSTTELLAAGIGDQTIRLWNLAGGGTSDYQCELLWRGLQSKVTCVQWHPFHHSLLAYGMEDGRIGVYDMQTKKYNHFRSSHDHEIKQLQWIVSHTTLPDNAGGEDNSFLESIRQLEAAQAQGQTLDEALVVQEGQTGKSRDGNDVKVVLWSRDAGGHILESNADAIDQNSREVMTDCAAFALDEQSGLLAVGLSNGVVKVLNWGDNNIEANRFHEHAESITCLTWSKGPNTGLLASGGQDGKIFVYSCAKSTAMDADDNFTPTRQRLHLLGGMEAHSNNVTGLRWCTDVSSGLLASSSADGSVQVWNAASLERVAYFKHHVGRALSLDWVSPYTLVTGGEDQTLRLWDYREQQKDPQTKQKKACKVKQPQEVGMNTGAGHPSVQTQKEKVVDPDTLAKTLSTDNSDAKISTKNKSRKKSTMIFHPEMKLSPAEIASACNRAAEVKYAGGDAEKVGGVKANEWGNNILAHADRASMSTFFASEAKRFQDEQEWESLANTLLIQGNVTDALRIVSKEGALSPTWLSYAPMAGMDVWREMTNLYAHQLDAQGDKTSAANSEAKAFDNLLQSDAPCGVRELFEFLTRPSGDKGENGVDGLNDSVLSGYATAIHAEEQLSKERVAHRGTHFWCQILSAYQECGYWFDAEGQVRIQEVQNLLVGSNCFVDVEKAVAASANGGQDSAITPLLQAAQRLLRFGIDVLSSSFIGALEHMREACLLLAQSDVRRSVEVTGLPSSGSEEGVGDFQLNLMLLLCPLGFASPKELPQCGELADEPLDTLVLWSSVLLSQCRIVLAAFVKNVSVPENVQLVESLIGSLLRLLRTQFLDEEATKPLSLGLMDHANQSQLQTLLNDILVSAHQLPDILSVVQESCADEVADQDKENKEPLSLKQTLIDDVNDLRSRLTWSADGVKE
ncbi:hypothetical protein PRNP1_001065 [Phytophthora ramorum]